MTTHKEIEIKIALTQDEYQMLFDVLSQNATPHTFVQNDFVCKLKTQEHVRIRIESDRAFLTIKKKIYNQQGVFAYCQETEAPIQPSTTHQLNEMLYQMTVPCPPPLYYTQPNILWQWITQSLGEKINFCTQVQKQRTEFKKHNLTYVLDEVKKLGYFLEIEQIVPKEDEQDETLLRQNLLEKAQTLGLQNKQPIQQGYSSLMHQLENAK